MRLRQTAFSVGQTVLAILLHAGRERGGAALEAPTQIRQFGVARGDRLFGRGRAGFGGFARLPLAMRLRLEAVNTFLDAGRIDRGARRRRGVVGRAVIRRFGRSRAGVRLRLGRRLDDRVGLGRVLVVEVDRHTIREPGGGEVDRIAAVEARRRAKTLARHHRPPTCAPSGMVAVISSSASMRNSTPSILKRLPA